MLDWIVHFSLRFRGIVVALACVLAGYGIYVTAHAKLDVFPNFVPPEVVVQTEAPGYSAEQVEVIVTRPIEALLNGLGGMAAMRSESVQGLSVITVVFEEKMNVLLARQMLAERLSGITGTLPLTVKAPQMSALTSATMDLLKLGLLSEKLSPLELRTFADWTLKPRLLAVPGVARCIVFGGEVRQLQVQIDPERLKALQLSVNDVLTAARNATATVGAGFVETAAQRIVVSTQNQSLDLESLGATVVAHSNGQSVRLRDIGTICEAGEPKFGDSLIMGKPGVLLSLASQYGANTMEVTRAVETALAEIKPLLDRNGITLEARLHRPATFIETSLANIKHSLYLGGILVAVVLFLFLGHFRTAFISLTAIPLSLLTAIIILEKFGVTLNTITLGGLAIAIGEMVDDAIIDVENIFRRLKENQTLARPLSVFRVVLSASLEVRSAVVYATFMVVLVFLPVLMLTGLQGSFFAPLAVSYILAILASLGVALTVTPALCLLMFARGVHTRGEWGWQNKLKQIYGRMLAKLTHRPKLILLLCLGICIATLFLLPGTGDSLLPDFREGHFVLGVEMSPGTSLPEMLRVGKLISADLLAHPNILTVEQQAGRAESGEDTFGPQRCEFHVELKHLSGEADEKTGDDIRKILGKYPGIQFEVMTFLGDRIGETITGESAPVVVNVFGNDLAAIDAKAAEIAKLLKTVPGAMDVKMKTPPGTPNLAIRLRPERLSQFGIRPADVFETLQAAYQGEIVAQTQRGNQIANVVVVLAGPQRQDPEAVSDLLISNGQGLKLPLSEIAEVYLTTGRYSIMHEGAQRRQVVTCQTHGRPVSAVVAEAKQRVAKEINFPNGMFATFAGAAEASQKARSELLLNSAIAAIGIVMLLLVVTGNWRNTILILANAPFALVGGVLALLLLSHFSDDTESGLSIGSLVGFVTLFGITTRNSIMLVSHFEHLVAREGMDWSLATAVRGAQERLIPILMTALVTGIGLLPLAIGSGEAGREIEGPMAVVILGGLITSTALNLLALPALAVRYGRFVKIEPDADQSA